MLAKPGGEGAGRFNAENSGEQASFADAEGLEEGGFFFRESTLRAH